MSKKPLLSVAIVIHNQRDVVEATLTSIYEHFTVPFELFLIDDGSTDGSTDVIQSLLDYYQHERTFYFQHERPTGRGNSLNEAILQCNGTLFWAPESIHKLDARRFAGHLRNLAGASEKALIQDKKLPSSPLKWMTLLRESHWPADGSFVWNLTALQSTYQFFNPYATQNHCLELAIRLGDADFQTADEPWYESSPFNNLPHSGFRLRQEMLLTLLRQIDSGDIRKALLEELDTLRKEKNVPGTSEYENDMLNEAIHMKKDGRFNAALDLIENVLEKEPANDVAQQLKIEILEKKRRFVEASELKHEVNKSKKKRQVPKKEQQIPKGEQKKTIEEESRTDEEEVREGPQEETGSGIEISIIIPSTTYGKPALEHCLLSISEHCDLSGLELIVIDNASLDDTHDYLDELKEKQFLNCNIITNPKNLGFAASVNQGLEKANGSYACILHNDVELKSDLFAQLKELMEAHPGYAVIGPTTKKTLNPDQAVRNVSPSDPDLLRAEYLDSFCMMLRMEAGLQMDEAYELAFFEDIDLCFGARSAGNKVGIAPHVEIDHHYGTTTFPLDLDTESDQYWKNVAYFNDKWGIEVLSEQDLKSMDTFDQLLALEQIVNPLYPEEEVKKQFGRLFTDELKTEILNTDHDPEVLCRLVHLFMIMDEREIMRRLEDNLENVELPATLIYQLVRFYYNRNIYSRCKHYLGQLKSQNESLRADLYRLAMLVENKDLDEAIPMLNHLMDHAPANPTLYKLAADIHKFNGNKEEAASFYQLARQINPFEFAEVAKNALDLKL